MPATNVEKLLRSLHDHGVEFVIIGGAAAVLHGSAYVTADLDLCYSRKRENLQRLAQALEAFHPLLRALSERVPFSPDVSALASGMNFTLTTDAGDLDIMGEVTGIGNYEKVAVFSEEMEIFGMPCKVLSVKN